MPHEYKKQSGDALRAAKKGEVIVFANEAGDLATKDEFENIKNSTTLDGSPVTLDEQVSGPAAEVDKIKIYPKEVLGVLEFFVRQGSDDGGVEVQITKDGALNVPVAMERMTPLWKGDTPGNLFVDQDVVACQFGRRVMYDASGADEITFDLPVATAADAGRRVGFHYVYAASKNPGDPIRLSPNGTDHVEGFGNGTDVKVVQGTGFPWFELEFDGNGRWNHLRLFFGWENDLTDVFA